MFQPLQIDGIGLACLLIKVNKIKEYLLNTEHPSGSQKAVFFRSLGLSPEELFIFSEELKQIAKNNRMQEAFETKSNGVRVRKYLSESNLRGKKVRTVLEALNNITILIFWLITA